jgi:hypothetical protein
MSESHSSSAAVFDLAEGRSILARTPSVLNALLGGLEPSVLLSNEGPATWSAHEVAAHLLGAERTNWIQRVRHLLVHGETVPFAAFDRVAEIQRSAARSIDSLIGEFEELRVQNVAELDRLSLTPGDLRRSGSHPEFGSVLLSQLLATWVVHDLTHLSQICRVLAKRNRSAVGPWHAYLRILSDREAR